MYTEGVYLRPGTGDAEPVTGSTGLGVDLVRLSHPLQGAGVQRALIGFHEPRHCIHSGVKDLFLKRPFARRFEWKLEIIMTIILTNLYQICSPREALT